MTQVISVLITLDCELPIKAGESKASGPQSWGESERFIRGYAGIARHHGFPVSYFLHPEVAEHHAGLFHALEAEGDCIDGLHLHPWKFDEGNYRAHFGGLTAEEQRALVSRAAAVYQRHIGRRPRFFRPGTFSANDSTFPVLAELGFEGGSVSAPERNFADLNAIWTSAPKDPHKAHRCFRQSPGSLPFVNIPLTSDFSTEGMLNGRTYFRDLRPDYDDTREGFARIIDNVVRQVLNRAPRLPVLSIVTHNDNDFANPNNRTARNFVFILEQIRATCHARGVEPIGATVAQVVAALRDDIAQEPEFVYA